MQRAIVALGEVLAHSVGSSEKRRLLAPTLAMGQVLAVTLSPFAGLCFVCSYIQYGACPSNAGGGWPWGLEAMAGLG